MHHKRGRPKDQRAGCLMCKPEKSNANKGTERRMRDRVPPDAPRTVAGTLVYDWCPDCNGTGRCDCSDCEGKTCALCGGSRICA